MTPTPYITCNGLLEPLWPEELITAGRLRRGSVLYRAIVAAKRACLRWASAVVSLTHAAVDHLNCVFPDDMGRAEGRRDPDLR